MARVENANILLNVLLEARLLENYVIKFCLVYSWVKKKLYQVVSDTFDLDILNITKIDSKQISRNFASNSIYSEKVNCAIEFKLL